MKAISAVMNITLPVEEKRLTKIKARARFKPITCATPMPCSIN